MSYRPGRATGSLGIASAPHDTPFPVSVGNRMHSMASPSLSISTSLVSSTPSR